LVRSCNTYGGGGRRIQGWWGNLRERDHFEDPGVDGRIQLRSNFRKWNGGMYWNDLAQDRDRCKSGNEPRVPLNTGDSLTGRQPFSVSRRILLQE